MKTETLNRHYTLLAAVFLALLLPSLTMKAQDVHFSQTGLSPLNFNPALTGVFKGDQRFVANFRRQWASVPVPYLQLSGAYDMRFRNKKGNMSPWSGGLLFNYDRAGDAELSLAQLGLSVGYSKMLKQGKRHRVTFGLMVGGMQRAFQPGELSFDDQYQFKEGFSVLNPTAEAFDNTSKFLGDISGGINLHLQGKKERTTFDVGAGVFHITEPKKNFFDEAEASLQSRYSLYLMPTFQLTSNADLLFTAATQLQAPHDEVVLGASGRYHVSQKKTEELALQAGFYYRPTDAFIPTAGIAYRAWTVNFSYDVTTSNLREANNRRGGPEVSVSYIIRQVPKVEYCKTCPPYM